MKIKVIIFIAALLLIVLSIGGYYYFINNIAPTNFVESFLEELEFKGASNVNRDYFISDYFSKPLKSWKECKAENSNCKISKE